MAQVLRCQVSNLQCYCVCAYCDCSQQTLTSFLAALLTVYMFCGDV